MSVQIQHIYHAGPLADCTQASLQAMNCAANENSGLRYTCTAGITATSTVAPANNSSNSNGNKLKSCGKTVRYYRHDPYAPCVLAPEDTVQYLERHAGQCATCQASYPYNSNAVLLHMMERSSASQYDMHSPSTSSFIAAVSTAAAPTTTATNTNTTSTTTTMNAAKRPHFMLPQEQTQQTQTPQSVVSMAAAGTHSPAHSGNTTAFSATTQDVSAVDSPGSYHVSSMSTTMVYDSAASASTQQPTTNNNTSNGKTHPNNDTSNTVSSEVNSPATTPMKSVSRVYVAGRPMPVRRRHYVEVKVDLRHSTPDYAIADVAALFGTDLEPSELIGRYVLVEGDRGEDMGCINAVLKSERLNCPATPEAESTRVGRGGADEAAPVKETRGGKAGRTLPKVLRAATEEDMNEMELLMGEEAKALEHCQECLQRVRLHTPIVIEGVLFQFDRKKLVVRYTSDNYVDFNPLTRALHNHYKCRIWMDQLNRDLCEGVHDRRRHYESKKRYFRGYSRRRD